MQESVTLRRSKTYEYMSELECYSRGFPGISVDLYFPISKKSTIKSPFNSIFDFIYSITFQLNIVQSNIKAFCVHSL